MGRRPNVKVNDYLKVLSPLTPIVIREMQTPGGDKSIILFKGYPLRVPEILKYRRIFVAGIGEIKDDTGHDCLILDVMKQKND